MRIRVGSFNLNNLFSRYNFQAEVADNPNVSSGGLTLSFDAEGIKVRQFMGRIVREKDAGDTAEIARRITEVIKADVLAVQEVEHIEVLRQFNRDYLGGAYSEIALIEGNDSRMIDVGVMSKLPLGRIVSHQAYRHSDDPTRRIFGRDLLEVEILDEKGKRLFTIFNAHMKSHFVPFTEDPVEGAMQANLRRKRQAEATSDIISNAMRKGQDFVLVGDMNDPPNSSDLAPMLTVDGQALINAVANAGETRPAKAETAGQGQGPESKQWTHRFNPAGAEPPHYALFDHIWLSQSLDGRYHDPMIDRRTKHGGDGSDHDPVWVDLEF